ncbi:MAG: SDR family oxidoreductase [bacterium]|nr:short-chain dehydrogenase [Deltaproteobacteria bacterium]MCP4904323.1 SDR family oxidoreductase [bacterium]
MERLTGRRALVTGAASGIGRATALRLASEGASVFCADIDALGAEQTAKAIDASGGKAKSGAIDVADLGSCEEGVERAAGSLDGLDLLANIAGILRPGHTLEQDASVFDLTISINLTGTFNMCRSALPKLLEGGGAIVNMASAAALQGVPYNAAYCASKAGVVGLTRSLASEYARREIRVNCICPGGVMTPMTQSGFPVEAPDANLMARIAPQMPKIGKPEDIAALVAYLASDEAGYMTGSAITIDGGQLA